MKPKAIFLDIDGTLTEPGTNVPPASALEAIRRAQEAGNYVFLCTGRNYAMLSPLLKYGFDGVVASSGGYVVCRDEVIYDSPMTDEERDRMSQLLKENGIFRTIECVEGAFTDDGFKNFLREHANEGENSEMLRWQEQIEKDLNILPMEAYKGQAVYKMVVMSPSMESLEICREELKDDFSFCIQEPRGGFVNGEIISRRFDKGTGVLKVCDHLGIPLEDSVGFGDSMNDKEMLEVAGLSVCMENGSAEMKKIADVICPSVTEDGIKKAFEKYPAVRSAHGAQRGHGQPGHAHRQRRGQQLRAGLQRRLWSGLADQQPCHFYGRSHEPDHVGLRLPEHRGRPAEAGAGGVVESNHPFGRSRSGDIAPGAWVCLRVFRLF